MSDEVDFLHADKHESFLLMNDMIVDGKWSSIFKIPKITILQYLFNISKKTREEWSWFLLADKNQRFLQIDTIILGVCD